MIRYLNRRNLGDIFYIPSTIFTVILIHKFLEVIVFSGSIEKGTEFMECSEIT